MVKAGGDMGTQRGFVCERSTFPPWSRSLAWDMETVRPGCDTVSIITLKAHH